MYEIADTLLSLELSVICLGLKHGSMVATEVMVMPFFYFLCLVRICYFLINCVLLFICMFIGCLLGC